MNPYLALLKQNRNFRLLYIGQTISQLGDWFNTVAVSPVAGVVVDRFDRVPEEEVPEDRIR